jgi:protoheme IX farnesyltransferase
LKNFVSFLKIIIELGKVRIALPVALSALAGYALFAGEIGTAGWWLAMGVFFMSCGSGAVNHWQEHKTDAKMPRTQNRPIPSGRISTTGGLLAALFYLAAGSVVLYFSNPVIALLLSWTTLVFYNLVYTPLKKVTAFAVIPGSMVGALPPIIGWSAAGGSVISEVILLVAVFFFIGQIPHFWLLLLMFGDQYKKAGMPSLNQIFTRNQINRITFTWVLTTVASALLVLFFILNNRVLLLLLLGYILYLLVSLSISMLVKNELNVKPAFYKLNFLYLLMMIFLITDSLIR